MKSLRVPFLSVVLGLLLGSGGAVRAELGAEPRFVSLEHIAVESAVEDAHEVLGAELEDVMIVADVQTNRAAILHENPKVAEVVETFLRAIDIPGPSVGMTFVTLNYVEGAEALAAARKVFGAELEGARAVLCRRANRVLIGGTKAARTRMEAFLVALDRPPRQIQIQSVITRVEKDGEGREVRSVLSQPRLIVQDGQGGLILSKGPDGELLEIKITARVIEPGPEK